jgi:pyridoxal phosphate enzyme (YggS family)
MTTLPDIQHNLETLREHIHRAAVSAGRDPDSIRLIAVSKFMTPAHITRAMAAGQHVFGENTVQDAMTKLPLIRDPQNEWHFIGHLQTNKARHIADHFAWLHTLDSLKLARKLAQHTEVAGRHLRVLIQVNISDDPDKFGLAPEAVPGFAEAFLDAGLRGISLHGLMTIGRHGITESERRGEYARLRELGAACAVRFGATHFNQLSMGMSDDYEIAIGEGATMVRIGTAIFGSRPQQHR